MNSIHVPFHSGIRRRGKTIHLCTLDQTILLLPITSTNSETRCGLSRIKIPFVQEILSNWGRHSPATRGPCGCISMATRLQHPCGGTTIHTYSTCPLEGEPPLSYTWTRYPSGGSRGGLSSPMYVLLYGQ